MAAICRNLSLHTVYAKLLVRPEMGTTRNSQEIGPNIEAEGDQGYDS